jgi:hypothetical protein
MEFSYLSSEFSFLQVAWADYDPDYDPEYYHYSKREEFLSQLGDSP